MHSLKLKAAIVILACALLPGCAAAPFVVGMIPGAPTYLSSAIGNGQTALKCALDERSTEQQMVDAIIAGHAQAEFYKHKDIRANQITAHCYFNKLYLVGEYDSQEQLRTIYECVDKVENKREVISHLYLVRDLGENSFFERQALYAEVRAQLMADFAVVSSTIDVQVVQDDIILLGVVKGVEERQRVMNHALASEGVNRVISYLYHAEECGPEPRILTAALTQKAAPAKPVKKAVAAPKRIAPKPAIMVEEPTAAMLVGNPDRGR